jgi:hypothetical protein
MENPEYVLILTGELQPGAVAGSAWPALAVYLGIDTERLTGRVLERAPLAIKHHADAGKLQALAAAMGTIGAVARVVSRDSRPNLFVLLDNRARGSLPAAFVEEQVRNGVWPDSLDVAEVGCSDWLPWSRWASAPAAPGQPAIPEESAVPAVAPAAEPPDRPVDQREEAALAASGPSEPLAEDGDPLAMEVFEAGAIEPASTAGAPMTESAVAPWMVAGDNHDEADGLTGDEPLPDSVASVADEAVAEAAADDSVAVAPRDGSAAEAVAADPGAMATGTAAADGSADEGSWLAEPDPADHAESMLRESATGAGMVDDDTPWLADAARAAAGADGTAGHSGWRRIARWFRRRDA